MARSSSKSGASASNGALGALMRGWRDARGVSQLTLSLDTGISQRHISFVESGRSQPSRDMLIEISDALDVPLRERNTLLQAAGYAPEYSESPLEALEMQSIRKALDRMLNQHAPFPAMVMDRYWNVLMVNDDTPRFFRCFIDMAARKGPRNMLHLMFDPESMRPFVADWERVAKSLLGRVYRESVGRVVDDKTRELVAALMAYPDVKAHWDRAQVFDIAPTLPMVPLSFVKDGAVLNYFSMVTTVGTPQTIAAQELRIECMFPTDDATERRHIEMIRDAGA